MTADPVEQHSFLDRLTADGRSALEAAGAERRHRKGAVLFREGDYNTSVLVVLDGTLKLTKLAIDGREVILDLRGSGDVLGELAAVDGSPRSATGTFLTSGRALHLTGTAFNALIDSEPSIAAATLRTVAHRLRDASDRQLEFGTADAMSRVCARLVQLTEGLAAQPDGSIQLNSPLSQQELADWAGVSRDAVVRALKTARDLGWLETGRQAFVIKDLAELRRHCDLG